MARDLRNFICGPARFAAYRFTVRPSLLICPSVSSTGPPKLAAPLNAAASTLSRKASTPPGLMTTSPDVGAEMAVASSACATTDGVASDRAESGARQFTEAPA